MNPNPDKPEELKAQSSKPVTVHDLKLEIRNLGEKYEGQISNFNIP